MSLGGTIDDQAYEAAFWMVGVYDADYPPEELGDLCMEVSTRLRTIAISVLLSKGKTDIFYHNLIRSGRVRERYLSRVAGAGLLDDHFRSSGWYMPLADVLAAGDFALARRLVELSPKDFVAGHEYEDDYYFAQILHSLLLAQVERGADLAQGLETYLDGESSARLEIANSLLKMDQNLFEQAFASLLRERRVEIEKSIAKGQFETQDILASRLIFVEGLAILRLAETLGLKTEAEYIFCPFVARVPMRQPFPGE